MSDSSKFSLLELPYLSLIEVLKIMNPLELLTLAQCSTKLANIMHWAGTKNYNLSVFTQRWYESLELNNQCEIRIFRAILNRMTDSKYTFVDENGSKMVLDGSQVGNVLVLQAEDREAEVLALTFHVWKIFKCRVLRFRNA